MKQDKRALYYWAKRYTEPLQKATGYALLSKAIGIHMLNFTSILANQPYHNVFHITEKGSGIVYCTDLELHTIELQKFSHTDNEPLADLVAKIKTLAMWSAFLTRHAVLHPCPDR